MLRETPRHEAPRRFELIVNRPGGSTVTTLDFLTADLRRLDTDDLVAGLADLEERLQLLDPETGAGDGLEGTKQDLVEAEYRILRELRRRHTVLRQGIAWTSLFRRLGWRRP